MTLRKETSWNQPPPMSRPLRIELPKKDWDALMASAAMAQTALIAAEARESFKRVGEAARNANKQMQDAAAHIAKGFAQANRPRDPRVKVNAAARA